MADVAKLRAELRALANKVPPRVNEGGIMAARDFKEAAMHALKLASNPRANEHLLKSAKSRLEAFW